MRHSSLLCSKCNPQCSAHQIRVLYLFDPTADLYTIVTEDMHEYRYAYGYAGIPRSCSDCAQDVLQHQIYHLVYHTFCRFCRYEMRALKLLLDNNFSMAEFKNSVMMINWRDLKTCSICLMESKEKNA